MPPLRPTLTARWIARIVAPVLCGIALASSALAEQLFRPLIADPRESLSRWRVMSFTEDWRYGTDITDSLSHGGVEQDRTGVAWEAAAGHRFRWRPLRRLLGLSPPWTRYQLGVPAAIFSRFDDTGSLLDTDYQFGGSIEVMWNGDYVDGVGPSSFARPIVTSRLELLHHSSHLGDEYLALSRFGQNQTGHSLEGVLFDHPPVKRIDLSYEAFEGLVAVEWAPGVGERRATLRAYAGGEAKMVLPSAWGIGALRPHNFRSPAARLGLELRSEGNATEPRAGWIAGAVNRIVRDAWFSSGWFAAADLRLAKPYDFASCDDPSGACEVWTPHLWTECPYGHEFRHYAGTWRAMIGTELTRTRRLSPGETATGVPVGPAWVIALEWYRGYSTSGQFLDQRLRERPRWNVVPSVTAHF